MKAHEERICLTFGTPLEVLYHLKHKMCIRDRPDDVKVYEMEHPDVLLWAVWCIQQYAKMEMCIRDSS